MRFIVRSTMRAPAVTIRALFETMRPRLDRYEWLYAPLIGPDFSATYAEHAAIVAAVRAGGAAAVGACGARELVQWRRPAGGRCLSRGASATPIVAR